MILDTMLNRSSHGSALCSEATYIVTLFPRYCLEDGQRTAKDGTRMSPPLETTKSCNRCGASIPGDSEYCEDCGTKLSETLIGPTPQCTRQETRLGSAATSDLSAKPRRLSSKTVVAVVVILSLITLALVVPWVPVVRSKVVQQELTYNYTYPSSEEVPKKELVFSSGKVSLDAFKSSAQSDSLWTSKGFLLEKGRTIQVRFESDNYALTIVSVKGGWQGDVYLSTSSRDRSFVVAETGEFHVVLQNLDPKMGHTVSVELTAEWTEVQKTVETVTQTTTFDVTKYDVVYVSLIDLLLHPIQ